APAAQQLPVAVGMDELPPIEPLINDRVPTDNGWPRIIKAGNLQVTVYQPQVESWDRDRLQSRAAVSVQTPGSAVPIYGVISLFARTDVDRENRLVTLNDIQIRSAGFPSQPDRAD